MTAKLKFRFGGSEPYDSFPNHRGLKWVCIRGTGFLWGKPIIPGTIVILDAEWFWNSCKTGKL